jgi:hypothetical protein
MLLMSSIMFTVLPTGATEQTDLAALGERADQVDDLDAGFQQFGRRRQLVERRSLLVDRRVVRFRSGRLRRSDGPARP